MVVAGTATMLAACTSSRTVQSPGTTKTVTHTVSASAAATAPVKTGPTHSADRSRCPILSQPAAAADIGERLARISVQTSGGRVVGCRFFDSQGAYSHSENLSGPHQPAIEISTYRFANAPAARNAMVLTSRAGANADTDPISSTIVGIAFQATFDPTDGKNADWAYTFAKGTTLIVIKINQTNSEFDVKAVAKSIAAKF
jgi:hypothetical protein